MKSLIAFVLVLVCSGCGDGLATVSRVVTLDGEPLRGGNGVRATVFFQPASGSGAAAVGMLDETGTYRLSSGSQPGVALGDYLITCTATQIIPSKDPGGAPSGRRITPARYGNASTSGLQFVVEPGVAAALALSTARSQLVPEPTGIQQAAIACVSMALMLGLPQSQKFSYHHQPRRNVWVSSLGD